MTRSEWIYNICEEEFATREKRDNHRERVHRQRTLIGLEKRDVERSRNGKFICTCGKEYTLTYSLRRHQKRCKKEILSKETGNDERGI